MNASRTLLMTGLIVVAGATTAAAQATHQATQSVTIDIQAVNRISVSAGTPVLTISSATAGDAPNETTASGTWAVTTNQPNTKVVAKINSLIGTGADLLVKLVAPTASGLSLDFVSLGTSDADLVTGISRLNQAGMALTFKLTATSAAVVTNTAKTVTFTVVGGV